MTGAALVLTSATAAVSFFGLDVNGCNWAYCIEKLGFRSPTQTGPAQIRRSSYSRYLFLRWRRHRQQILELYFTLYRARPSTWPIADFFNRIGPKAESRFLDSAVRLAVIQNRPASCQSYQYGMYPTLALAQVLTGYAEVLR